MSIYKDFPVDDNLVQKYIIAATPVGSRVTCSIFSSRADIDWLVLVEGGGFEILLSNRLKRLGWLTKTNEYTSSSPTNFGVIFKSFRLGEHNLIITESPSFHKKFLLASSVAKKLDLLVKEDRVALFQAILYGNAPE